MDWQPIKTAPKDGTWIILLCPNGVPGRTRDADGAPPITLGRYEAADLQDASWLSVEAHHEHWDYGGRIGVVASSYPAPVEPTRWAPIQTQPKASPLPR